MLINIFFPDGSVKKFSSSVTLFEVADSISPVFRKKCLLAVVDGLVLDMQREITKDASVRFILNKPITESDEKIVLEIMRHSCSHILGQAVQELFPGTKLVVGPVIKDGFYYDFSSNTSFKLDDLIKIEKRMRTIIDKKEKIIRTVYSKETLLDKFRDNLFKLEILSSIPNNEVLTVYSQGEWFDLCRGPHVPNTSCVGHSFKLMSVSGSSWLSRNKQDTYKLQRIYGTCWLNENELQKFLVAIEKRKTSDHRLIASKMELFHFDERNAGMVFWHPKGWKIVSIIKKYLSGKLKHSYKEISTPVILDKKLWEESGHWEKFKDNMFIFSDPNCKEKEFAIKPMNCPGHIQIFKKMNISHKSLPLRLAEFGCCHRAEPTGSHHGLLRVKAFIQDDAHIFCTKNQITKETIKFCTLLKEVYSDFGFNNIKVLFSTKPEKYIGDDQTWKEAEVSLLDAINKMNIKYTVNSGEGAFYGPKLEFVLEDVMRREWQCGTLQVDFFLAKALNASYVAASGKKEYPVILHRAILGSIERFLGILIENCSGKLPLWLSPIHLAICSISEKSSDYASEISLEARKLGIDFILDNNSEKISYKIRKYCNSKIPIIFVVGEKEKKEGTVNQRILGETKLVKYKTIEALEIIAKKKSIYTYN